MNADPGPGDVGHRPVGTGASADHSFTAVSGDEVEKGSGNRDGDGDKYQDQDGGTPSR